MATAPEVTPDSLLAAPRLFLTKIEQEHAAQLVRKGQEAPWNEYQRRYAGELQAKAYWLEERSLQEKARRNEGLNKESRR